MSSLKELEMVRHLAGLEIRGRLVAIGVYPRCEARDDDAAGVGVSVTGLPVMTGFDQACRLVSDGMPTSFSVRDISVDETLLSCFAPAPRAPVYREGFTVALERGMATLLRNALSRIAQVSLVSRRVVALVERLMPQKPNEGRRPYPHQRSVIEGVVADVLLDGAAFDFMLDVELAPYAKDETNTVFKSAMQDPAVRALLRHERAIALVRHAATGTVAEMTGRHWHRATDLLNDEAAAITKVEDQLGDPDYTIAVTKTGVGYIVWTSLERLPPHGTRRWTIENQEGAPS